MKKEYVLMKYIKWDQQWGSTLNINYMNVFINNFGEKLFKWKKLWLQDFLLNV